MAKRKASIFDEIVGIFVIGVAGLLLALPYIIAFAFYTFPIALVWLKSKSPEGEPPALSDISDDASEDVLLSASRERDAAEEELAETIANGRAEGVRFLRGDDRFENRSNRGKELNDRIYALRELIESLDDRVAGLSNPLIRHFTAWRDAYSDWHASGVYTFATKFAGWTFVAISILYEAIALTSTAKPMQLLIANPFPSILRAGLVVGALAGWLVIICLLLFGRSYFRSLADKEINLVAEQLTATFSDGEEVQDQDEEDAYKSDEYVDDSPEELRWHEVLKVSEDASNDEVKAAYKMAIKRCHPDMVANLSDNIREAALGDTIRINAAYEKARAERRF